MVISTRKNKTDSFLDIATFAFFIFFVAIMFYFYGKLPENIPVHFNIAGQPDRFGDKSNIWQLIVICGFLYTFLAAMPYLIRHLMPREENKGLKEKIALLYTMRLLRVINLIIVLIFFSIAMNTVVTALKLNIKVFAILIPVLIFSFFPLFVFFFLKIRGKV